MGSHSSKVKLCSGSHQHTIVGYSSTDGTGIGNFPQSNKFSIGGYEWYLQYCLENNGEYIYCYLGLANTTDHVKARYQIVLLDSNGNSSATTEFTTVFEGAPSRVYQKFSRKHDLEELGFLRDDKLTVRCIVTVIKELQSVTASASSSSASTTVASRSEPTSSVIELFGGFHQITIAGYSQSKSIGIGTYITSDTFTVGGYDWCLLYFPDGLLKEDEGEYISLVLGLLNANDDVKGIYNIVLLDSNGTSSTMTQKNFCPQMFDRKATSSWILRKFIRKQDLEASGFLQDDSLTVKCDVIVVKESNALLGPQNIVLPSSSYSTMELITESCQFEMVSYFGSKGIGIGMCIKSETFIIGGYKWCLQYYPDGFDNESNEYISLGLELVNGNDNVKALYKIVLLDSSGQPSLTTQKHGCPFVFKGSSSAPVLSRFMRKCELEASNFLRCDSLTVKCTIMIMKNPKSSLGASSSR